MTQQKSSDVKELHFEVEFERSCFASNFFETELIFRLEIDVKSFELDYIYDMTLDSRNHKINNRTETYPGPGVFKWFIETCL